MKRRLVPENEAPRQDAVRQLERAGEPSDGGVLPAANRTAPRCRRRPGCGATGDAQEPLAELKSAQSGAASAPAAAAVPMAAPAPAQAMPAIEMPAAPPLAAAAKAAPPEGATRDAVPEKAEKKAGQLGFGKTAEEAGGMMPGIEAQSTPGAMPGMGMGGGAFGGTVAPDAVRERQGQVQLRAAGRGDAAGYGSMYGGAARPSAGAAASDSAREPAPSIGEKREADRAERIGRSTNSTSSAP